MPPISPVQHGALDYSELERLGLDPDRVLDFSVNSNPFGASPHVRQALAAVPLERYPDKESLALRRALGERLGVSPAAILVGNGAAELIWLAAFALLRPGDDVLLLGPTFGEYARSVQLMGAKPHAWNAPAENGFKPDAGAISHILEHRRFRAIFVCNPNNPTGQTLPAEVVAGWAAAHPATLFFVDEAYIAFIPGMASVLGGQQENILILRSMTKDYALAGLRLGYVVGAERLLDTIAGVRPPWNVNALAQAAGLAALHDEPYYRRTLAQTRVEKAFLTDGLAALGYAPCASLAHFFLLPVGDGRAFRERLLPHGLVVRDCASFGLPEYVRIAPRTRPENIRLLETLSSIAKRATAPAAP